MKIESFAESMCINHKYLKKKTFYREKTKFCSDFKSSTEIMTRSSDTWLHIIIKYVHQIMKINLVQEVITDNRACA